MPKRDARLRGMRRMLGSLITKGLDAAAGAIAIAVRTWMKDFRRRLGDLTRQRGTVLEGAAQQWLIVQTLDELELPASRP